MLVLKIKEKSFIYSCHKNIYRSLFISTLWLSGSAGIEAELYPGYRNHSRRSPQFTTHCNLHFLLLSAPYCKGSREINNKSRKNRTDNLHLQHSSLLLPSHELPKFLYRSVQILPSVGERWDQNVPKSNPLGSDGLWNATAPNGEHLLAPIHSGVVTEGETWPGWIIPPPNLQRSQGGRCRGDRTTSVRWQRLQCALCFLFLCFLSFFLLAHLEQNHCTSSGGAVVIPTQGLGRRGKYRSQWSNVDFVFYPKKRNLQVGERIWPSN